MSVDDLCPQAPGLRHMSIEALTALRDQVHAEIASRRGGTPAEVVRLFPSNRIEECRVVNVRRGPVVVDLSLIAATGDREDER